MRFVVTSGMALSFNIYLMGVSWPGQLFLVLVEAWRTSTSAGFWPRRESYGVALRNKTDRNRTAMPQTYPDPNRIKKPLSQEMQISCK